MPPHYMMHRNNMGMTAEELFNTEHAKLLHSAQTWIRGTAQSCSAVAALVATVVFAAAYTAPGGYSSGGAPVLRHSPFFTTFIITDVVSLISSLSSLVTFLSILTSPFEYKNFHQSLPLRLHLGFAFLFFSLVTTMLVFTATAVLLIHLDEELTRSLLYVAAFLPVSVFGLIQLPLYAGFSHALIFLFKKVKKFIISFFLCFAAINMVSEMIGESDTFLVGAFGVRVVSDISFAATSWILGHIKMIPELLGVALIFGEMIGAPLKFESKADTFSMKLLCRHFLNLF